MQEILSKIVKKRISVIKKEGITFGVEVPNERQFPVVLPDFDKPVLISEIKRGSPSEGRMNDIKDPVKWASDYLGAGADVISILTEKDFFYGSLQDLIDIKDRFPKLPVLRKDFLLSTEEVDVSYRAGADMILLIASVLIELDSSLELMSKMNKRAEELGMLALVEVHDQAELEAVMKINPKLVGINSRDLKTFKINRGYPVGLKSMIDSSAYTVFESGIRNYTDAFFIGTSGFNAILVGSSIVKSGNTASQIKEIKKGFVDGKNNPSGFYPQIFKKIYIDKKLVVKVCGITNIDDAKIAVSEGADILGFILADSPREVTLDKAKEISLALGDKVLKVGVVVDKNINEAVNGVKEGWLDAVQFHGDIDNDKAASYGVAWYKAIRVAGKDDFHKNFYCPIILFDTFVKDIAGGTGKRIDEKLLDYAKKNGVELYLAGGINPDNVREIVSKYQPLMLDVSSGLEERPGRKSKEKIKRFFEELDKVRGVL